MTYTVTDNCKDCMFTDCVEVCPVDCFYGWDEATSPPDADKMIYIHPDECIDCGLCEPECPVEAIHPEDSVPDDKKEWTVINAERSQGEGIVNISEKRDQLAMADERKKALGF